MGCGENVDLGWAQMSRVQGSGRWWKAQAYTAHRMGAGMAGTAPALVEKMLCLVRPQKATPRSWWHLEIKVEPYEEWYCPITFLNK